MEYDYIDWKKILDDRVGNGMGRSLKGATVTKRWKWRAWQALVGYTITDLRTHVESLFQAGMTWDNYGEWHLDHIVPKYFFRYASESDLMFKACWSLPNLTPMWGNENVAKGIKPPSDYSEIVDALPYLTAEQRADVKDRIDRHITLGEQDHLKDFVRFVKNVAEEYSISAFFVGASYEAHTLLSAWGACDLIFSGEMDVVYRRIEPRISSEDHSAQATHKALTQDMSTPPSAYKSFRESYEFLLKEREQFDATLRFLAELLESEPAVPEAKALSAPK